MTTPRCRVDDWLAPLYFGGAMTCAQLAARMLRLEEAASNAMRILHQRGYVYHTGKRPRLWRLTDEGVKRAELFFVTRKAAQ